MDHMVLVVWKVVAPESGGRFDCAMRSYYARY